MWPVFIRFTGNSLLNWPSTRCQFSIFDVRINSVFPLECTLRTGTVPTQIFDNVRCPILHIKTNTTPQCWCGMWWKGRLSWKLKISHAVDNADITQSQVRDNRHRRMQEVNSLCTDGGALRAITALCHSTQYSLLVLKLECLRLMVEQSWSRPQVSEVRFWSVSVGLFVSRIDQKVTGRFSLNVGIM